MYEHKRSQHTHTLTHTTETTLLLKKRKNKINFLKKRNITIGVLIINVFIVVVKETMSVVSFLIEQRATRHYGLF